MLAAGEATRLLRDRVGAVGRRLAGQRAAIGALAAALLSAPFAWSTGVASIVIAASGVGAWLGVWLPRGHAPVAWLDRRARGEDVVLSAVAVADGRTSTALGERVVADAARVSGGARLPSLVPLLVTVPLVVALALVSARSGPGARSAAATKPTRSAVTVDAPAIASPGATPPAAPLSAEDAAALVELTAAGALPEAGTSAGGGVGTGAGDREAVRVRATGTVDVAPAGALSALAAPQGGASPATAAVSARYRSIVAAYLEAP
jgi:hypothetical protein